MRGRRHTRGKTPIDVLELTGSTVEVVIEEIAEYVEELSQEIKARSEEDAPGRDKNMLQAMATKLHYVAKTIARAEWNPAEREAA